MYSNRHNVQQIFPEFIIKKAYEVTGVGRSPVDQKAVAVFAQVMAGEPVADVDEREAVLLVQHALERRVVILDPDHLHQARPQSGAQGLAEALKARFRKLQEVYVYNLQQNTLYQYDPASQQGIEYSAHSRLSISLLGLDDQISILEKLPKIKTVMTVVAGNHATRGLQMKAPITNICLGKGYTKILVTDSDLAKALVAKE